MILETTLLIDRWLQHDTYGVEAMLQTISRQNPEGTEFRMPAMPCILNDFEDESVVTELDPDKTPALVLYVDTDVRIADPANSLRQIGTRLLVTTAYLVNDVPPNKATQDGAFILRAVRKSLTNYNSSQKSEGYRKLNDIKIAEITEVSERRIIAGLGTSQMFGFVFARVLVIDSQPA